MLEYTGVIDQKCYCVASVYRYKTTMDKQLLSDEAYICTGIYLTIIGTLAVAGNILVLVVLIWGRPNFIRIHTVLMFVIAVSDLTVSAVAYPLTAISGYYRRWYFDRFTCKASAFLVYFCTMCTINSLCVMAICRYFIVCRPELEYYIRGRRVAFWTVGIGLYALFWTGSPLVGWSSYGPEPFQTSCTVNWYGRDISDVTYNSLCIVFCYCLPLAIYIFCYYNVLKKCLLRNACTPVSLSDRPDKDNIVEEMTRNTKLRASRHMTYICLALVCAFVVIWTPYAILTFWNLVSSPAPASVQVLPTMFAKLNCIINPIIYSTVCDRFKEAASRVFRCRNQISPDRSTEQQQNETVDITVMMLEDNRRRSKPEYTEVIELEVHDEVVRVHGELTPIVPFSNEPKSKMCTNTVSNTEDKALVDPEDKLWAEDVTNTADKALVDPESKLCADDGTNTADKDLFDPECKIGNEGFSNPADKALVHPESKLCADHGTYTADKDLFDPECKIGNEGFSNPADKALVHQESKLCADDGTKTADKDLFDPESKIGNEGFSNPAEEALVHPESKMCTVTASVLVQSKSKLCTYTATDKRDESSENDERKMSIFVTNEIRDTEL